MATSYKDLGLVTTKRMFEAAFLHENRHVLASAGRGRAIFG